MEAFKGQAGRYDAHPDSSHAEKSVASTMEGLNMHINAPKTDALDSNKSGGSGFMAKAVAHLNRDLDRNT